MPSMVVCSYCLCALHVVCMYCDCVGCVYIDLGMEERPLPTVEYKINDIYTTSITHGLSVLQII